VGELAAAGIRRISLATSLYRAAMTGLLNAAHEVKDIHRSTIVNLYRIKEIQPWFHGYYLVLLEGGKQLRLSRYQSEVSEHLGIRQKQPRVGTTPDAAATTGGTASGDN
jgi:LytTr DNA-binding domain